MIATPAPVARELTASDMCWELQPAPAVVHVDVATDALLDAQAYRELAQAAIHWLHDLHQQHDRLRERLLPGGHQDEDGRA